MFSREVALALMKPIPPEYVGDDGRGNDAIPWYMTVAELNRIFGPWGWDHRVISTEVREKVERKNTVVTVSVVVELIVRNNGHEVIHRSVGVDTNFGGSDQAHRVAEMGAEHIALKRAAVKLGPAFGLHLYDGGGRGSKVRYPWNVTPLWADAMKASVEDTAKVEPVTAKEDEPPPPAVPDVQPWEPSGEAPAAVDRANSTSDTWNRANRMLHGSLGDLAKARNWSPEYRAKACELIHWAACQSQEVESLTEVDADYLLTWSTKFSDLVRNGKYDTVLDKIKAWAEARRGA